MFDIYKYLENLCKSYQFYFLFLIMSKVPNLWTHFNLKFTSILSALLLLFFGVILGSEGVAKGGKLLIKQCVLLKVYT